MKKFFMILCGILIMGNAFGAPNHYQEPKYHGMSPDHWNAQTSNGAYTKPLTDYSLYPNLATQMSKVSSSNHGTHDDEGAVVLIMARSIYDNGGIFCMTQVQAANHNGRRYTWIDYYDYPGKYKCETLCRPGYYGASCKIRGTPDSCYTDVLDFGTLTKQTSGEWGNQITDSVEVFLRDNAEASPVTTAEHRILAVVKKMDHGVIVSPVSVVAERYQDGGKKSYVKSVSSNGNEFLLCAKGYEPNATRTDCQEPSWCGQKKDLDTLCPGYTADEYVSDIHKLEYNETEKCHVIKCDYSGYGFKSANDRQTCVECDGGALAYIKSDGTCGLCRKGEIANETRDDCINEDRVKQYSKDQMKSNGTRQCWLETDGRKFSGCVHGCSDTEACYIDGDCEACD